MNHTTFEAHSLDHNNEKENLKDSRMTTTITHYLRWVGSLLIVLSAITFMLQGYQDMLPTYRYWAALGFTLILCAGGITCAYLFKETKGARVFFGLATAFIPVQVSQVGAMIYAFIQGENAMQPAYEWLQFMEISPTIIAIDFLLTIILLCFVSYAGFSILARKQLYTLLLMFCVGNALLFIPIRDSNSIAAIMACLLIVLLRSERQLHGSSMMRLIEGMSARAIIWIPAAILVGRSLLHPTSVLYDSVILAFISIVTIYDIQRYTQSAWIIFISQCLGSITALAIWILLVDSIPGLSAASDIVLFLPLSLVLFLISEKVTYYAKSYRSISATIAILVCFNAMLEQQTLAPVAAMAAGILLSIAGLQYREKLPFFLGNLSFAGGLLFYSQYLVDFYAATPWLSTICLGLFVILLASYIENREIQIRKKSKAYFHELKTWN